MVAELKTLYDDLNFEGLRVSRPSKFLFLCGGLIGADGARRPANLRDYLYRVRRMRSPYEVVLAEAATQLYRDTDYHDLISFEEDIARIASVVLVIPESPGSLAELGAFTANETICRALRIVVQQQYETAESFVRYGPIERVQKQKRDYLGVYPWRVHLRGGLNVNSVRPHYREIVAFINGHLNAIATSTAYSQLGKSALFYVVYWIIFLSLAVSPDNLYSYVKLLVPEVHEKEIRNKIYCMQLARWIERLPYSGKDYFYVRRDLDPFSYSFKPGVSDNNSIRRKLTVTTALRRNETLPPHVRAMASLARAS